MEKPNKSYYDRWSEANPIRTETITKKVTANKITKFQPYLDGGLTSNNNISDIQKFISDFNSVTLAFIQQATDVKDKLFLTMAAIPAQNIEWTDNLLAQNVYKPLVKTQKLKEMVIAFGGAAASKSTNPWSVALQITNNVETKASEMLKTTFLDYAKHITDLAQGSKNDYPKYLDFDLEGQSLVTDLADIQFLIRTLTAMKKADNELSIFESSFTLPVLPTGLTKEGLDVLNSIIEIWSNANLDLNTLPIINIMTMDYGEYYYDPNKSNFDLLQEAVDNTKNQLKTAIVNSYHQNVNDDDLYSKLGCTPMIGINDQQAFIFTLEDAKQTYNWANEKNLGVIRIWSFNDDAPLDIYGSKDKTLFCHGLAYLNEYDFVKAFSGKWDDLVQNPYTSPNQSLVPPVPRDIKQYIKKTYLGDIDNNDADFLLEEINKLNNCNFTYQDIKISEITEYQAHLTGRIKYQGSVYISFSYIIIV